MRKFSRLSLFSALLLVLLTAACAAEQGATPTVIGTVLPDGGSLTSTPFSGVATETTETAIGTVVGLETATTTTGLESPTAGVTTQIVGTQTPGLGNTQTPVVPVTGQDDIMLVECQFCVDTRAHALVVLPDTATFQITSPAVSANTTADVQPTCTTVEVNNGRQVVLCSGPEMTPLVINICTDAANCTDFPVDLLACPLTQGGSVGPANTQAPGTGATATSEPGIVTNTPPPGGTATASPTAIP